MGETTNCQEADPLLDANDHVVRGAWAIRRDPGEDVVKVIDRSRIEVILMRRLGESA
jgi:hypothetical protein